MFRIFAAHEKLAIPFYDLAVRAYLFYRASYFHIEILFTPYITARNC